MGKAAGNWLLAIGYWVVNRWDAFRSSRFAAPLDPDPSGPAHSPQRSPSSLGGETKGVTYSDVFA